MKIIHIGNLANNSYKLVKFLRQRGIEAELALEATQAYSQSNSDPCWEDPELNKNYPKWIKVLPPLKRKLHFLISLKNIKKRKDFLCSKYDIIHAQCTAPAEIQFYSKPFIAHSLGSDLRELAQKKSISGTLMRRAYKICNLMLYNNSDQIKNVRNLKIQNAHFYPNPIDTVRFSPKNVENNYQGKITFFHPVNLDWTYKGNKRSSTKGNDRLLKAFSKFCKKTPGALLILIESGVDVEQTKYEIKKLRLEENTMFLPRLSKIKLIHHINASDVIIDQFDVGSLGGIALEALACGKPVITYSKKKEALECYGELPPIFNCHTEDQIYEQLLITCDPKIREERGKQSREWILKYHEWPRLIDKLIEYYISIS